MVETTVRTEAKIGGADVEALTPNVGAILRGVTLSGTPDASTLECLHAVLARHLVVVVEDQALTARELRDFASHFGPVHHHHDDTGVLRADGVPEVLEMRKEADGERLFGGMDWHADVTFRRPAGYISVLHALVVPAIGGDTGFAGTIAAFDALGDRMQELLRGLEAVHSYDGPGRPDHEGLTAIHPVVRQHPDTGAEGIYLNRMFATRFVGMSEYESRPLIEFLDRHMSRAEFTCRVRWRAGQVVLWDNRFTLHYPINDFTGHERLLLRCVALEG